MDIQPAAASTLWRQAPEALGWRHSPVHARSISSGHVDADRHGEGGHASGVSAEDAYFLGGVETIGQAVEAIRLAA